MDLYQVCSNNTPGAKSGTPGGSHVLHRLIEGKCEKNFLSEATRPRALIFGMTQSARKRRITRIGTHVFPLGRMIFARPESRVRMFF